MNEANLVKTFHSLFCLFILCGVCALSNTCSPLIARYIFRSRQYFVKEKLHFSWHSFKFCSTFLNIYFMSVVEVVEN